MDNEYDADHPSPSLRSRHQSQRNPITRSSPNSNALSDTPNIDAPEDSHDVPAAAAPKQLPFEFKALEACLESACRCLESEVIIYYSVSIDALSVIVVFIVHLALLCLKLPNLV